ncbi:MAG: hypothetical protein ACYCOU_25175, partial [Sulfobacillus sp.]
MADQESLVATYECFNLSPTPLRFFSGSTDDRKIEFHKNEENFIRAACVLNGVDYSTGALPIGEMSDNDVDGVRKGVVPILWSSGQAREQDVAPPTSTAVTTQSPLYKSLTEVIINNTQMIQSPAIAVASG